MPGADFDVVFVQQAGANLGFVDAVGYADGRERAGAVSRLGMKLESHRLDPGMESTAVLQMTFNPRFEPFLGDERQRLVDGINHVDWRGMVIDAAGHPVIGEHLQVEVPALDLRRAALDDIQRLRIDRQRGEARGDS